MQNHVDPSFFLTGTTGEPHGLLEDWITLRFSMSWSSWWTSSLLHGGILLTCCLIGWWSPVLIERCSLLVLPIWLSFIAKTSAKPSRRLNRWCFCCTFRVLPLFSTNLQRDFLITSKSGSLATSVALATTHVVGSLTANAQAKAVPSWQSSWNGEPNFHQHHTTTIHCSCINPCLDFIRLCGGKIIWYFCFLHPFGIHGIWISREM